MNKKLFKGDNWRQFVDFVKSMKVGETRDFQQVTYALQTIM